MKGMRCLFSGPIQEKLFRHGWNIDRMLCVKVYLTQRTLSKLEKMLFGEIRAGGTEGKYNFNSYLYNRVG